MSPNVWNAFAIQVGIAAAFGAGVIMAVALGNIPLGVGFGVVVGMCAGAVVWRRSGSEKGVRRSKDG